MRVHSGCQLPPRVEIDFVECRLPDVLSAELTWSKKIGPRVWESGLKFIDKTAALNQALTEICRMFRFRRAT